MIGLVHMTVWSDTIEILGDLLTLATGIVNLAAAAITTRSALRRTTQDDGDGKTPARS